jgi:probable phosphoglycerate mutase
MSKELWLVRHGETAWTISGQHTGRTDLDLTRRGEEQALQLQKALSGRKFSLVLVSPLKRALETCRIAGFLEGAAIEPNLQEWDYGDYEGRTSAEIKQNRPDWTVWTSGVPNGETVAQVGERAKMVIARALEADGDVALFGHGHMLRILAATWLGLSPADGRLLALDTTSISVLGYERETPVIRRWNLVLT